MIVAAATNQRSKLGRGSILVSCRTIMGVNKVVGITAAINIRRVVSSLRSMGREQRPPKVVIGFTIISLTRSLHACFTTMGRTGK